MASTGYADDLLSKLDDIARALMKVHVDHDDSRNAAFLADPDAPLEHAPQWHQWGIVTHTRKFGEFHATKVPVILAKWGLQTQIDAAMSETIDGETKAELMRAAIALHDLGKFTHRSFDVAEDGSLHASFADHEARSGEHIREAEFQTGLKQDYGLTNAQIEYIAKCAELHFVLAILRDKAKLEGIYNMAFARSEAFPGLAREIMGRHPGFELEMGLLFVGDSLAKTEMSIEAERDEDIDPQHDAAAAMIEAALKPLPDNRKFDRLLIRAVLQSPINMEVARNYLVTWAEDFA